MREPSTWAALAALFFGAAVDFPEVAQVFKALALLAGVAGVVVREGAADA